MTTKQVKIYAGSNTYEKWQQICERFSSNTAAFAVVVENYFNLQEDTMNGHGIRTSAGNEVQFQRGDRVRVLSGSQWHTGHTGTVVDCDESRVLVTLPGPQPRTNDREWLSIDCIEIAQ
jgi:hypothetical protein